MEFLNYHLILEVESFYHQGNFNLTKWMKFLSLLLKILPFIVELYLTIIQHMVVVLVECKAHLQRAYLRIFPSSPNLCPTHNLLKIFNLDIRVVLKHPNIHLEHLTKIYKESYCLNKLIQYLVHLIQGVIYMMQATWNNLITT